VFTYDDIVRVKADAPPEMHPGARACVIGVTAEHERRGSHFEQFPAGTVYLVEFEDGDAIDIHVSMLAAAPA
jgi:hypothetical protein